MYRFTPNKIALEINKIKDEEVQVKVKDIHELQKEIPSLNNGMDTKIKSIEQSVSSFVEQINNINSKFKETLNSIKTQIIELTNYSLRYVQLNQISISNEEPMFKDSFLHLSSKITNNLQKMIEKLNSQLPNVLDDESDELFQEQKSEELDLNEDSVLSPNITPENLLTSSIKIADIFNSENMIKQIQVILSDANKIEPIIIEFQKIIQSNQSILEQIQEIIENIVNQKQPTNENQIDEEIESEETDISKDEIDSATELEDKINIEEDLDNEEDTEEIEIDNEEDIEEDLDNEEEVEEEIKE